MEKKRLALKKTARSSREGNHPQARQESLRPPVALCGIPGLGTNIHDIMVNRKKKIYKI